MSLINRVSGAVLCAGLGALFFSLIAKAQSNYLVPDPSGCGVALNNNGQILCRTGLYSNGTFTPFPGGFAGWALSESGVVAGYTAAAADHLAIYSAGAVTDLGGLPALPGFPPTQQVYPSAINASGEIAGTAYNGTTDTGFVYSNGTVSWIGPPPGSSALGTSANGMNDSGQVVGCTAPPPAQPEAFTFANGALTDLGPGCASAINASGQITGGLGDAASQHAFVWTNGKLTVLTEPAPFNFSSGGAINNKGQIVGGMMGPNLLTVFFYNGVMTDVNSLVSASDPLKSKVRINEVWAINDSRLMLVSGVSGNGAAASYLLQAPWLDVVPGPLTFASQDVGTKSQPQTLTLTNSGTAPLPLDSISIASAAADFSQTNACPPSLVAGANCTVSVTFSPTKPGDQSTFLNVVTAGATISVPLAATAAVTITLSANPASPSVGSMFTIAWSATAGSTCQSSGGNPNDGWIANTASGSTSVIEAQPGVYTYNLACSAGSVSAAQSIKVTVANPPASGGGGALDLYSLLLLAGLFVLNWQRKPS
jgi:probable HAF family extracellular repeat protein